MKNLYKYLLFFIIGLILFILLNSKDGFSIGIEPFIYTAPGSTNIHYTTSNAPINTEHFLDLAGTGVTVLNGEVLIRNEIYNDITQGLQQNNPFVYFIGRQDHNGLIHIPIIQEQGGGGLGLPDGPQVPGFGGVIDLPGGGPGGIGSTISSLFMGSSCAATSQRQDIYIITGNLIELVDGYYTVSKSIRLTIEEYILIQNLLFQCTDEEGEQVLSILRSDNKSAFLRDLNINIRYYQDTPEQSSIRYQGLINYYSGNSFTINHLIEYGLNYILVHQDGNFRIYRLIIENPVIYNLNRESIQNLYVRSGNSRQQFGQVDTIHATYVLTEGSDDFIRCRLNYNNNATSGFTCFPVGHGYGPIFLRMLYESEEDVIIESLNPEDGNTKAYRRLFRLSVTPNSIDSKGFVKSDNPHFTIYIPDINLMRTLYPHYNDLYTYINQGNREHFNLFLMSLSEDILTENLIDSYNPEVLKQMYDDF